MTFKINIPIQQVLYYLGYKDQKLDSHLLDDINSCIQIVLENMDIKYTYKLFDLKKSQLNQKNEMENFSNEIKDNFDTIENELYYKLKDMAAEFFKENDKLNSENLLLQKYLTSLTKEKMDLLVQINLCMNRLDELEKYLGINIANKRNKKTLNNQK